MTKQKKNALHDSFKIWKKILVLQGEVIKATTEIVNTIIHLKNDKIHEQMQKNTDWSIYDKKAIL